MEMAKLSGAILECDIALELIIIMIMISRRMLTSAENILRLIMVALMKSPILWTPSVDVIAFTLFLVPCS